MGLGNESLIDPVGVVRRRLMLIRDKAMIAPTPPHPHFQTRALFGMYTRKAFAIHSAQQHRTTIIGSHPRCNTFIGDRIYVVTSLICKLMAYNVEYIFAVIPFPRIEHIPSDQLIGEIRCEEAVSSYLASMRAFKHFVEFENASLVMVYYGLEVRAGISLTSGLVWDINVEPKMGTNACRMA